MKQKSDFTKDRLSKPDLSSSLQDWFVFSNDYVFGKVLENIEDMEELSKPSSQILNLPFRLKCFVC